MTMAEDVVAEMEKMKLTVEEEETIEISDEGRQVEIESCKLSLIGKLLTCKPFNKRAAKNTLKKAWGLENEVQIMEVGANLFQFKFNTEFDLERILNGGPWSFDNQMLMLTKWQKGMKADNVRLNHASLWIQIWGTPFDMLSTRVATEVGSRLGEVVEVEWRRKQEEINQFMRVKVALSISKPLRRGGFIAGSEGERSWVMYKYERLPLFCHFCGILGHDLRHCASHFSATKNGRVVEYQYGDWLKATGGSQRLPPKRKTQQVQEPSPDGGSSGENVDSTKTVEQTGEATAAGGCTLGNPRVYDSGKSGDVTDGQLQNPAINAARKPDKERSEDYGIEEGNVISNSKAEVTLEHPYANHVDLPMQNRLTNQKPKSTWVRLRRMECGPNEIENVESQITLGKRVAVQMLDNDVNRDKEERTNKKGKTEVHEANFEEISARVGQSPLPEAMRILSWNCQGLGNPWTVRSLRDLVRVQAPMVCFLMETRLDKDGFKKKCGDLPFPNKFVVKYPNSGGGLVLLWKDSVQLDVVNFTANHILAKVVDEDGFLWYLTGFY